MRVARAILLLGALLLGGCHTARHVAVSSFRVIDAPASYVRRHIGDDDNTTTTTTTTTSDVVNPGRPIEPGPPPASMRRRVTAETTSDRSIEATQRAPRNGSAEMTTRTSPPPPQRNASASAPQFPTAKPVPGKPGFVYSPYDPNGGYVDVTGYGSGSKAKDPYSQKIFIVP
jgi:hypothetical protein